MTFKLIIENIKLRIIFIVLQHLYLKFYIRFYKYSYDYDVIYISMLYINEKWRKIKQIKKHIKNSDLHIEIVEN